MSRKIFALMFCLAVFGVVFVPRASAVNNDEMILNVRKGPVDVPGRVLEPGTYDLCFANLEHTIVFLSTANGREPIGFFPVIPVYRQDRTDNAVIRVSKAPKHAPAAIYSFFYPGRKTGYQFLYPHAEQEWLAESLSGS